MASRKGSRAGARSSPVLAGVTRVVDALPAVGGERREKAASTVRDLLSAFRRHRLATHSTALAFRVLVSLVPLVLLGIGLLGALGQDSYWTNSVSPRLHRHFTQPVALAVDDTAYRIFAADSVWLLLFASALLVWNTLRGIRSVEHALDDIQSRSADGRRCTRSSSASRSRSPSISPRSVRSSSSWPPRTSSRPVPCTTCSCACF